MDIEHLLAPYQKQVHHLQEIGNQFWKRGWSLGTSSNYSVVIGRDPLRLLVTASGKDKGHLLATDFVLVDERGNPVPPGQAKSSAETLLHCSAAMEQQAGAVLHTHSVWATILSEKFASQKGILFEGYEFLKGLEGLKTHEDSFWLPIFDNTQDIPKLRAEVEADWKKSQRPCFGYLIRRHGMYTWGGDLQAAVRHMEVLEFLLECLGRSMLLP